MRVSLVSADKASRVFAELKSSYRARRRPISVWFRTLACEVGAGDGLTHLVRPYPDQAPPKHSRILPIGPRASPRRLCDPGPVLRVRRRAAGSAELRIRHRWDR